MILSLQRYLFTRFLSLCIRLDLGPSGHLPWGKC